VIGPETAQPMVREEFAVPELDFWSILPFSRVFPRVVAG